MEVLNITRGMTCAKVVGMHDELLDALERVLSDFRGKPFTDQYMAAFRAMLQQVAWVVELHQGRPGFYVLVVLEDRPNREVTVRVFQNFARYPMTEEEFYATFLRRPSPDELERINCTTPGTPGHTLCGWCYHHNTPHSMCGCTERLTCCG